MIITVIIQIVIVIIIIIIIIIIIREFSQCTTVYFSLLTRASKVLNDCWPNMTQKYQMDPWNAEVPHLCCSKQTARKLT